MNHIHGDDGLQRRVVLARLAALGLTISPAGALLAGCGNGGSMPGMGGGSSAMPDWMMGDGMMDSAMMADMPAIHDLLVAHDQIRRQVDDVDAGIHAQTTSADPRIAQLIRTHVQAMHQRIVDGRPIRQMDPLFREIFKHHTAITMTVTDIAGGVDVTETSADPQVALLIRQHARRAVSEFVASGMARAMQPTPLPDGYHG
jgi:hypothetical protein